MRPSNEEIKKLYFENGYTLQAIASLCNISRQRIHQIVKDYETAYHISFATRPHLVTKTCTKCGNQEATKIHHLDRNSKNNKPQNLVKLCKDCHVLIHKELKIKRQRNKKHFS